MQTLIHQAEFAHAARRFLVLRQKAIVSVREYVQREGLDVLLAHSMGSWIYDARQIADLKVEIVSCPSPLDEDDETPGFMAALATAASAALQRSKPAKWLAAPERRGPVSGFAIYREGELRFAARKARAALVTLLLAACQPQPPSPVDAGRACCTPCSQTEAVNGCPPSICLPTSWPGDGGVGLCCDWSRLNPVINQGGSHASR